MTTDTDKAREVRSAFERSGHARSFGEWHSFEEGYWAGRASASSEIAAIQARLVEAEREAAHARRYRWIRDIKNDWSAMFNQTPEQFAEAWANLETGKTFETLDAAIDAAITAQQHDREGV